MLLMNYFSDDGRVEGKTYLNKIPYCTEMVKNGKAIPLQAWTGPQSSRRLRVPDFKTIGT
jgi:hypothetical protein